MAKQKQKSARRFGLVEAVLAIVILMAIDFVGSQIAKVQTNNSSTVSAAIVTNSKVANVYVDKAAEVKFSYPKSWTLKHIKGLCAEPEGCLATDDKNSAVELISPDGSIDLVWSGIGDINGECNVTLSPTNGGCPQETVFSSTKIKGSTSLYVVEGALQDSSGSYQPFMAVQDIHGVLRSGVHGLWYQSFVLPSTGKQTVFFMDNGYENGGGSTPLSLSTLAKARNYFSAPDIHNAQQILLSLQVK